MKYLDVTNLAFSPDIIACAVILHYFILEIEGEDDDDCVGSDSDSDCDEDFDDEYDDLENGGNEEAYKKGIKLLNLCDLLFSFFDFSRLHCWRQLNWRIPLRISSISLFTSALSASARITNSIVSAFEILLRLFTGALVGSPSSSSSSSICLTKFCIHKHKIDD